MSRTSSEAQLIARCRQGDVEAFETLIAAYEKKVLSTAYAMLGNHEDASDAAQEVFLKLFASIDKFGEQSSFSTWLYRVTVNVCYDELRKRKYRSENTVSLTPDETGESAQLQLADKNAGPLELAEQAELRDALRRAIASLGEQYRTVIILREIQGLEYQQIADILHCSLGTVKSRMSRARRMLADKLIKNKELFR